VLREKAVPEPSDFEIPPSLCHLASAMLDQARYLHSRAFEPARRACGEFGERSEVLLSSAMEFHKTALRCTKANIDAHFELMHRLIKAKDAQAAFDIQIAFSRNLFLSSIHQARELSSLVSLSMQQVL
jgi:hypothetical protein